MTNSCSRGQGTAGFEAKIIGGDIEPAVHREKSKKISWEI